MQQPTDKEELRELIEKYLDNRATLSECARIDSWLESDKPVNRWLRACIENSDPAIAPELRQRLNDAVYRLSEGVPAVQRRWPWPRIAAVAAAVVATSALTAAVMLLNADGDGYADRPFVVATAAGEHSRLTLPDGTVMTLNNMTEVAYRYDASRRERTLALRGEAAFDVATDPERPFVVSCDGLRVECRGTSFNVKGYPDEGSVTVVLSSGVITSSTATQSITMKPGNKVVYDKRSRNLNSTMVDAADYTEWTCGVSRFNDETLESILRTVSRQYGVEVSVLTPSLRDVRLTGSVGRKPLNETLAIIAAAADANYLLEPDSTVCFYRGR